MRTSVARSSTPSVGESAGPRLGIHEDPVCDSAHCQIADLWACELGRDDVLAYEASVRVTGGRVRYNAETSIAKERGRHDAGDRAPDPPAVGSS